MRLMRGRHNKTNDGQGSAYPVKLDKTSDFSDMKLYFKQVPTFYTSLLSTNYSCIYQAEVISNIRPVTIGAHNCEAFGSCFAIHIFALRHQ